MKTAYIVIESTRREKPSWMQHEEKPKPKLTHGVFEHHHNSGENSYTGYVVRSKDEGASYAYPYNKVKPVREYQRPGAAQAHADKLNETYSPHIAAVQGLPKIIRYDHVDDSGEFGNASCPHCGAKGRYVHHFLTEDGPRAAMAGCIKLFPTSPIADEHRKISEKERSMSGQTWPDGREKKLNSWDRTKMDAINEFYNGERSEDSAIDVINQQKAKAKAWARGKYGR